MSNTTDQKAAPALYDAGDGYHFIISKVDAGAFQVFMSEPDYCDGAFFAWHRNRIRRAGAEALARWLTGGTRDYLAKVARAATPQEQEYAGAALGMAFSPEHADRIARDFDTAAEMMPYLEHASDPWELALTIVKARPWEIRRDFPEYIPF